MSNPLNVPFDLDHSSGEGYALVAVRGDLDVLTTPLLREASQQAIATGSPLVVIDLSGVTFLDSSALGAFVTLHKELTDSGRELRLASVPANVLKVFEITGLIGHLHVYDIVATALITEGHF